jgi:hypothetical protein
MSNPQPPTPNPQRLLLAATAVTLIALLALQLAARVPGPEAAAVPTPTPAPQQVQTRNPKLGIHTRLTDEADPAKITRTLQMVREMGASWVVEYFPWAYIQPSDRAHYDWTHTDTVIAAAQQQGLTLVARLDGVPAWARPPDTTWRYIDPDQYAAYAAFVEAFVTRYRGRVHYVIIWNEPNLSSEWGVRPPDPAAYTALLKTAYAAAKRADPTVQVLMAGLAPTLVTDANGMHDTQFLQGVYDAGGKDAFDLLAVHAYGNNNPPDDPPSDDVHGMNFARAAVMHDVMARNGDGAKKVIITEGGWNDSPRWVFSVKPYQRIAYTIRAYEKAQQEWPWCLAVGLWAFRLPAPAYTYMDNYTFVTPDFIPRPIYDEVRKYAVPGADGGTP